MVKEVDLDLLVESSWEVCNKIGGIYTVLSTKSKILNEKYGDKLLFIGPDVWDKENPSPFFDPQPDLLAKFCSNIELPYGIEVRSGRWKIPGSPQVLLVKFQGVYSILNDVFSEMWNIFGVDSLHEYGDYREACAFSVASAIVISQLIDYNKISQNRVIAHFNEWTTGMGLLYLRHYCPGVATVFTTHATSIGRSICGNGKPLYDYFYGYHGDQMASELNMEAKHSLEKTAAHVADCFTTVSDVTARECEQLLDVRPNVITPNGFEPNFVPGDKVYTKLRKSGRDKIFAIAEKLSGQPVDDKSLIVATSGRNEFRNKGIDIFIDSLRKLQELNHQNSVIGLILVPAWVKEPVKELAEGSTESIYSSEGFKTHHLNNEESDSIMLRLRELRNNGMFNDNVKIIFIPCYLDGCDGILNISYYDILPAIDLTVFPSYYEPWGYTPLESIAFGIPTVTTDKSGFGQWIISSFGNSFDNCGVEVIKRNDSNYNEVVDNIAGRISDYSKETEKNHLKIRKIAKETSKKADWRYFISHYYEAFTIAENNRNMRLCVS